MACFVAPAAVAIITTAVRKKIPPRYHIEWLNTMLWGGVLMLIVDHVASGEIIARPPFLMAIESPAGISALIPEIILVGGAMTATIIAAWAIMVIAAHKIRAASTEKSQLPAS